jgi:hypothetical protein
MPDIARGRFVWYDLTTPDPESAGRFYPAVLGWGTASFDAAGSPYTMWTRAGGGPETSIGGIQPMTRPPEHPPHWLAYVSVPDPDAVARRVEETGGKVWVPPRDIPTVGRFTVFADPHGATISAYAAENGTPDEDPEPAVGDFSWNELTTGGDPAEALAWYGEIFGWKEVDRFDMGPDGPYVMFGRRERPYGGIFRPPQGAGSWLHYVRVPDVERAVAAAREAGGSVRADPMEVPGGDRIAQLLDPQGVPFAVHQTAG